MAHLITPFTHVYMAQGAGGNTFDLFFNGNAGPYTIEGQSGAEEVYEVDERVTYDTPDQPQDFNAFYRGAGPEGIFVEVQGSLYYFSDDSTLDGQQRTLGEVSAACFLAGTLVACPGGERPVESLAMGDFVLGSDGAPHEVRWIGQRSHVSQFADRLRVMPVRISAGALGDNIPGRDLYLSPDHAVLVGNVLVQAGAMVNGTTVTRLTRQDVPLRFTYFHIELDNHVAILADGAPCESFVANVSRAKFENFGEYLQLFGQERFVDEMDYPRAQSARQVPQGVRAILAEREKALGFTGRQAA